METLQQPQSLTSVYEESNYQPRECESDCSTMETTMMTTTMPPTTPPVVTPSSSASAAANKTMPKRNDAFSINNPKALAKIEKKKQLRAEKAAAKQTKDEKQHQPPQHGSMRWNMISPYPNAPLPHTVADSPDSFRVMTFNVLAPGTVRRDMYRHCNAQCLKWTFRRQLIMKFMIESKADILCLQECDQLTYASHFEVEMKKKGFTSRFLCGGGTHGIAIFFNHSKFAEVKYQELNYAKVLAEGRSGLELDELDRGNIGQLLALKPLENNNRGSEDSSKESQITKGLIVTNTHLFWNWKYEFVKLKQMETLLEQMLAMRKDLQCVGMFHPILAGDFNLCPDSVVYKVVTGVPLSEDDNDYLAFLTPEDHMDDDANNLDKVVNDGVVGWKGYKRQPISDLDKSRLEEVRKLVSGWKLPVLSSAYGHYSELGIVEPCSFWSGEPPHTCFVQWRGTIDYLFTLKEDQYSAPLTQKLSLNSILELLTEEELSVQTALPNDFVPSDHIPLMASFSIVSNRTEEAAG